MLCFLVRTQGSDLFVCVVLQAAGYDRASFKLLLTHFWHRLLGTSVGWFCNDFLFYGNATFRNRFIRLVTMGLTVIY